MRKNASVPSFSRKYLTLVSLTGLDDDDKTELVSLVNKIIEKVKILQSSLTELKERLHKTLTMKMTK